jgi:uncharacterized protein (DUF736 family)
MTTIGTFSKAEDGTFHGAIRTLTLNVKALDIRPVARTSNKAPDHRVFAGAVELGAAWTVSKPDKPECLSVQIDDPSFAVPLKGFLAQTADGYELRWIRDRT